MPCDGYSRREERHEAKARGTAGGERAFAWSLTFAPSLLVLGGIALLVWGKGAGHGVGIALLIVALLLMAVPISLVLAGEGAL